MTSDANRGSTEFSNNESSFDASDRERCARAAFSALTHQMQHEVWTATTATGLPIASRSVAGVVEAADPRSFGGDPWVIGQRLLNDADRHGHRFVVPGDPEWPATVADDLSAWAGRRAPADSGHSEVTSDLVASAPAGLWISGGRHLLDVLRQAVTIVGARACTSYGDRVAMDIAEGLTEHGWTIVAGGSFGIDASAHQGALVRDGATVLVSGAGLDCPYPAAHSALFRRIAEGGLLVSEYPLGRLPSRLQFQMRGRLLAALTAGTVLVEARVRGSARLIAHFAHELERPVMAVPGPVTSASSTGCHDLIRHHDAILVTSPTDVHDHLETARRRQI